jgi:PAS domain-containing protein
MNLWDFITQNAQALTLIFSVLGSVLLSIKRVRTWLTDKYKKHQEYNKSKHLIPSTLQEIKECVMNLDDRVKRVEYEISPNGGGSMKDSLNIVKAEIEALFWLNPKPSFRTTSKGLNIQVNESYCHLCGTSSEELLKQNWKNFIEDGEQLDDFMRRWEYSSDTMSQYSGKLKFKNSRDESLGEWVIKVRPLGPIKGGQDYLWHGSILPYDQKARECAKSYNIPLN